QGIFLQDASPSLYLSVQRFSVASSTVNLERRGFIGLGRIEDYSAGVVYRHEQTLAKPKADRLKLLRATRAHFGQLFMVYGDLAGDVDGVLAPSGQRDMESRDEYGVLHQVWKFAHPGVIELVRGKMRDKKLIIADGHHRYETALIYRNERRAMAASTSVGGVPRERTAENGLLRPGSPSLAPYDLVMVPFINMDAPGLVILPTHRVVQLHRGLLQKVLGISEEAIHNQQNIRYIRDAGEAMAQARSGKANVAFLMNPVRMEQVRDIAFAGEVLPQKSTDFYPKLLSGFTIYALE